MNEYEKGEITDVLEMMAAEIRALNIEKGWRNPDGSLKTTFGESIALIHSEASEALDAYREAGFADLTAKPDDTTALPKPEGVGSELADALIRVVGVAEEYGIDLPAEFHRKMAFNWTRPARHGGKRL